MSTQETQNPLTSKTIWGLLIALAPDLANVLAEAEGTGAIPPEIAPIVRTIGIGLAFIGRWGARLPLSLRW